MSVEGMTDTTADASAAGGAREPDPEPLLRVRDLRVMFSARGRRVHAVNGLSYGIREGRMLAIIGESGSGKSVSARTLMGLLPGNATVSGSARFRGTELVGMPERAMRGRRGSEIAMVFQDPARSLNPTMRVGTQVTEAVRAHADLDRHAARERGIELLRRVRLPDPAQRFWEYPHQLSGGMRQRVMIAIALAGEPRLLIADEATTALDVTTQAQIMELLVDLQRQLGMAVVLISHDLGLAASYAQDIVVMYAGRAVESAPADHLFGHVKMPYTAALLGALPRLDRAPHTLLPVVPGHPPDLSTPPGGCPFRPRCDSASEACEEQPPYDGHDSGHSWACWHPRGDAVGKGERE